MIRTVRLSIIRSLFTVHSGLVYVILALYTQLSSRSICSCSKAVYKPVWHIPLLTAQWINTWWWTDELSETCTVSCQNQFVKLVHLVGSIIKKFVTMHGHMNVKLKRKLLNWWCDLVWSSRILSRSRTQRVQRLPVWVDMRTYVCICIQWLYIYRTCTYCRCNNVEKTPACEPQNQHFNCITLHKTSCIHTHTHRDL
jgi:hypothetical protein